MHSKLPGFKDCVKHQSESQDAQLAIDAAKQLYAEPLAQAPAEVHRSEFSSHCTTQQIATVIFDLFLDIISANIFSYYLNSCLHRRFMKTFS